MFSIESTVVASPDQVSCDVGEESVILDLAGGTYYGLNTVGAHIWQLIQEPRRIGEIEQSLLEAYDVTPERCHQELLTLLEDLAQHGLVKVGDGAVA